MKLTNLVAELSSDDLGRMARDHVHVEESLGLAQLRAAVEGVLKSHRFLQDFIFDRQPPAFAILTLLLDAEDNTLPVAHFAALVQAETTRICVGVDAGLIVGRDEQLRVYRRVLHQARSNDLQIDPSEAAILGVLRHELSIAQVEHFLIEHHADLREFWRTPQLYERELEALRAACIVFVRDGRVCLPNDQVIALRRVLGVDMSSGDALRLYNYLANTELHDVLEKVGLPTSGSKDDRASRLVTNMVQPRAALALLNVERLRTLCRDIGAPLSGSKDEIVERIVAFVGADKDLEPNEVAPPVIREERRLDRLRFARLFELLRAHELTTLLVEFELRRSGTKDVQIQTLWEAERSEVTLLSTFSSPEIEGLLRRIDLKVAGSKAERIERLLAHFSFIAIAPPPAVDA